MAFGYITCANIISLPNPCFYAVWKSYIYLLKQHAKFLVCIIKGSMERMLWRKGKTPIWHTVMVAILEFYKIKVSTCIPTYPTGVLEL